MVNPSSPRIPWLLLLWLGLGGFLRLYRLGDKAPWTDEFATVLYGRGDDYGAIAINQILSASELLAPLKGYPIHGFREVSTLLIQQNNHPPLYFLFVNLWQKIFPLDVAGYIFIDSVRFLSVIFGVISILVMYWIAKKNFHAEIVAQISAALITFSPFHVYLSQEARHYTLIILVAIASLGCCLHCLNSILQRQKLTLIFSGGWLLLNITGLLIHYFFALTLISWAIAFIWLFLKHKIMLTKAQILQISFVVLGLVIFGLIWCIQVLPSDYGSTMTDWIRLDRNDWLHYLWPLGQFIIALSTMLFVLPIQVSNISVVITSILLSGIFSYKILQFWRRGIQQYFIEQKQAPFIFFLGRSLFISWLLFVILIYGFGYDITRGARYHFIYFPNLILLLALGLSYFWQREYKEHKIFIPIQNLFYFLKKSGSRAIATIFALSFLGSLCVVNNWAYQKPYNPTSILQQITASHQPALIVTPYKSTVQIGELMAIAYEQYRQQNPNILTKNINNKTNNISFALIPFQTQSEHYQTQLNQLIQQLPVEKFKLWTLNLQETQSPTQCINKQPTRQAGYYGYIYDCESRNAKI